jgi:ferric-dicitrate binding protein FerR (iron transport regulator)
MKHEELFDKFLQRTLSPQEMAELKFLLRHDSEAGRHFVAYVGETSLLIRVGTQLQSVPGPRKVSAALPWRHLVQPWWKWAAAAALVMFGLIAWRTCPATPEFRATLVASSSEVTVIRDAESLAAEPSLPLRQGDTVHVPPQARAVVSFDGEATRVELQGGAQVKFTTSRRGKLLDLSEGAVEAAIAPQPANRPLKILTLHAETRVMGTHLGVSSEVSSTRLEVTRGAAQFVRRSDGKVLRVTGGFCATAGPNAEWCTHPFLPAPWQSQDIGAVGLHGQARYDGTAFRIRGAGQDTCSTKDQLHYLYQPIRGDAEIRARVHEVEFTDPEAKATVMIRQSLKSASKQVSLGLTASGGLEIEARTGAESRVRRTGHSSVPLWLRLVRNRETVTAFTSTEGTNWVEIAAENLPLGDEAYIGLGVTSFNHAALSTSIFEHVTVVSSDTGTLQTY